MLQSRGGMGMHKHGISGHPTRPPGYKLGRTREANAAAAADRARRPVTPMYPTLRDLMDAYRRR
jgi:hypothetical protein